MPRAVLRNGVIYPIDPLPPEWADGQEVWVEGAQERMNGEEPDDSPEAIDRWYQELNALVATNDPEDLEKLETALAEADRQAKAQVRREMGLPDA